MVDWPLSKNVPALRGVSTGFYQWFIKNYGLIAKPLMADNFEGTNKANQGFAAILMVVDRLDKSVHFNPLKQPFTGCGLAWSFVDHVVKLHDISEHCKRPEQTIHDFFYARAVGKLVFLVQPPNRANRTDK
ncbi:hypothetical protein Nepgr_008719 [Nepenthes gracilis]|uniref:Uncharacterized protein n=1 Tax=Nepenthes gracilis TaxID=150966 RepID=A0AAD3S9Y2_NEPGR|nr:hypothetical protein Nepgr_008719 [Nepenthes gracilis]